MTERFIMLEDVREGHIRDEVAAATLTAVFNSMVLIAEGQRIVGLGDVGESTVKATDGTLLTRYDSASEERAQEIFDYMLPGVPFKGEEGANTAGVRSDLRIGYDPLDGTRAKAAGVPTSTVIGTAYNSDGSVYGAAIGEPITGRIFSAFGPEARTEGRLIVPHRLVGGKTLRHNPEVTTWSGTLAQSGQVFLDNNQPFSRQGHDTINAAQHRELRGMLQFEGVGVMEVASNGAHQLYVTSGADRAAGAITTARGIQEDTSAGAFLVERAGGAVQRYNAVNGQITPVEYESPDYDMLVVANHAFTLQRIDEMLKHLVTYA